MKQNRSYGHIISFGTLKITVHRYNCSDFVLISMQHFGMSVYLTSGSHKGRGRHLNGKLSRKLEVSNPTASFEPLQALASRKE